MNDDKILAQRARIAAGCSWDGNDGGHGNAVESQEPEVRRILRECAHRLVSTNPDHGFIDTTCEACGCRVIVKQNDDIPLTLCPPCGGGSTCAAYGTRLPSQSKPKTFQIVDTDNFGRDYPDEKVFIDSIPTRELAEKICDAIVNKFISNSSDRFYKVVDSDYVLQPGFEP